MDGALKQRNHVVNEILATEEKYLQDLRTLRNPFVNQLLTWKQSELFPQLALNLNMVIGVNESLLEQLTAARDDNFQSTNIGAIFQQFGPMFKTYKDYIAAYPNVLKQVEFLTERKRKFRNLMTQCSTASGMQSRSRGLGFRDFLIMPAQRVPRYLLLLKELLKHTPESAPDYQDIQGAVDRLKSINTDLNSSLDQKEAREAVLNLQQRITTVDNKSLALVAPARVLLKETSMKLTAAARLPSDAHIGTQVEAFLFSDIFILTVKCQAPGKMRGFLSRASTSPAAASLQLFYSRFYEDALIERRDHHIVIFELPTGMSRAQAVQEISPSTQPHLVLDFVSSVSDDTLAEWEVTLGQVQDDLTVSPEDSVTARKPRSREKREVAWRDLGAGWFDEQQTHTLLMAQTAPVRPHSTGELTGSASARSSMMFGRTTPTVSQDQTKSSLQRSQSAHAPASTTAQPPSFSPSTPTTGAPDSSSASLPRNHGLAPLDTTGAAPAVASSHPESPVKGGSDGGSNSTPNTPGPSLDVSRIIAPFADQKELTEVMDRYKQSYFALVAPTRKKRSQSAAAGSANRGSLGSSNGFDRTLSVLPAVPTTDPVSMSLLSGPLDKKKSRGLRNWQKRYYVLLMQPPAVPAPTRGRDTRLVTDRMSCAMVTFASEQAYKTGGVHGRIVSVWDIDDVVYHGADPHTGKLVRNTKDQRRLDLQLAHGSKLEMRARTPEDARMWVVALGALMQLRNMIATEQPINIPDGRGRMVDAITGLERLDPSVVEAEAKAAAHAKEKEAADAAARQAEAEAEAEAAAVAEAEAREADATEEEEEEEAEEAGDEDLSDDSADDAIPSVDTADDASGDTVPHLPTRQRRMTSHGGLDIRSRRTFWEATSSSSAGSNSATGRFPAPLTRAYTGRDLLSHRKKHTGPIDASWRGGGAAPKLDTHRYASNALSFFRDKESKVQAAATASMRDSKSPHSAAAVARSKTSPAAAATPGEQQVGTKVGHAKVVATLASSSAAQGSHQASTATSAAPTITRSASKASMATRPSLPRQMTMPTKHNLPRRLPNLDDFPAAVVRFLRRTGELPRPDVLKELIAQCKLPEGATHNTVEPSTELITYCMHHAAQSNVLAVQAAIKQWTDTWPGQKVPLLLHCARLLALGGAGQIYEVQREYNALQGSGDCSEANLFSLQSTLLLSFGRCGEQESARELMRYMGAKYGQEALQSWHFDAVVQAAGLYGEYQSSEGVIADMLDASLHVSTGGVASLIEAYSNAAAAYAANVEAAKLMQRANDGAGDGLVAQDGSSSEISLRGANQCMTRARALFDLYNECRSRKARLLQASGAAADATLPDAEVAKLLDTAVFKAAGVKRFAPLTASLLARPGNLPPLPASSVAAVVNAYSHIGDTSGAVQFVDALRKAKVSQATEARNRSSVFLPSAQRSHTASAAARKASIPVTVPSDAPSVAKPGSATSLQEAPAMAWLKSFRWLQGEMRYDHPLVSLAGEEFASGLENDGPDVQVDVCGYTVLIDALLASSKTVSQARSVISDLCTDLTTVAQKLQQAADRCMARSDALRTAGTNPRAAVALQALADDYTRRYLLATASCASYKLLASLQDNMLSGRVLVDDVALLLKSNGTASMDEVLRSVAVARALLQPDLHGAPPVHTNTRSRGYGARVMNVASAVLSALANTPVPATPIAGSAGVGSADVAVVISAAIAIRDNIQSQRMGGADGDVGPVDPREWVPRFLHDAANRLLASGSAPTPDILRAMLDAGADSGCVPEAVALIEGLCGGSLRQSGAKASELRRKHQHFETQVRRLSSIAQSLSNDADNVSTCILQSIIDEAAASAPTPGNVSEVDLDEDGYMDEDRAVFNSVWMPRRGALGCLMVQALAAAGAQEEAEAMIAEVDAPGVPIPMIRAAYQDLAGACANTGQVDDAQRIIQSMCRSPQARFTTGAANGEAGPGPDSTQHQARARRHTRVLHAPVRTLSVRTLPLDQLQKLGAAAGKDQLGDHGVSASSGTRGPGVQVGLKGRGLQIVQEDDGDGDDDDADSAAGVSVSKSTSAAGPEMDGVPGASRMSSLSRRMTGLGGVGSSGSLGSTGSRGASLGKQFSAKWNIDSAFAGGEDDVTFDEVDGGDADSTAGDVNDVMSVMSVASTAMTSGMKDTYKQLLMSLGLQGKVKEALVVFDQLLEATSGPGGRLSDEPVASAKRSASRWLRRPVAIRTRRASQRSEQSNFSRSHNPNGLPDIAEGGNGKLSTGPDGSNGLAPGRLNLARAGALDADDATKAGRESGIREVLAEQRNSGRSSPLGPDEEWEEVEVEMEVEVSDDEGDLQAIEGEMTEDGYSGLVARRKRNKLVKRKVRRQRSARGGERSTVSERQDSAEVHFAGSHAVQTDSRRASLADSSLYGSRRQHPLNEGVEDAAAAAELEEMLEADAMLQQTFSSLPAMGAEGDAVEAAAIAGASALEHLSPADIAQLNAEAEERTDAFVCLLNALANASRPDLHWKVLEQMEERWLPPSPSTAIILIETHATAGRGAEALMILARLEVIMRRLQCTTAQIAALRYHSGVVAATMSALACEAKVQSLRRVWGGYCRFSERRARDYPASMSTGSGKRGVGVVMHNLYLCCLATCAANSLPNHRLHSDEANSASSGSAQTRQRGKDDTVSMVDVRDAMRTLLVEGCVPDIYTVYGVVLGLVSTAATTPPPDPGGAKSHTPVYKTRGTDLYVSKEELADLAGGMLVALSPQRLFEQSQLLIQGQHVSEFSSDGSSPLLGPAALVMGCFSVWMKIRELSSSSSEPMQFMERLIGSAADPECADIIPSRGQMIAELRAAAEDLREVRSTTGNIPDSLLECIDACAADDIGSLLRFPAPARETLLQDLVHVLFMSSLHSSSAEKQLQAMARNREDADLRQLLSEETMHSVTLTASNLAAGSEAWWVGKHLLEPLRALRRHLDANPDGSASSLDALNSAKDASQLAQSGQAAALQLLKSGQSLRRMSVLIGSSSHAGVSAGSTQQPGAVVGSQPAKSTAPPQRSRRRTSLCQSIALISSSAKPLGPRNAFTAAGKLHDSDEGEAVDVSALDAVVLTSLGSSLYLSKYVELGEIDMIVDELTAVTDSFEALAAASEGNDFGPGSTARPMPELITGVCGGLRTMAEKAAVAARKAPAGDAVAQRASEKEAQRILRLCRQVTAACDVFGMQLRTPDIGCLAAVDLLVGDGALWQRLLRTHPVAGVANAILNTLCQLQLAPHNITPAVTRHTVKAIATSLRAGCSFVGQSTNGLRGTDKLFDGLIGARASAWSAEVLASRAFFGEPAFAAAPTTDGPAASAHLTATSRRTAPPVNDETVDALRLLGVRSREAGANTSHEPISAIFWKEFESDSALKRWIPVRVKDPGASAVATTAAVSNTQASAALRQQAVHATDAAWRSTDSFATESSGATGGVSRRWVLSTLVTQQADRQQLHDAVLRNGGAGARSSLAFAASNDVVGQLPTDTLRRLMIALALPPDLAGLAPAASTSQTADEDADPASDVSGLDANQQMLLRSLSPAERKEMLKKMNKAKGQAVPPIREGKAEPVGHRSEAVMQEASQEVAARYQRQHHARQMQAGRELPPTDGPVSELQPWSIDPGHYGHIPPPPSASVYAPGRRFDLPQVQPAEWRPKGMNASRFADFDISGNPLFDTFTGRGSPFKPALSLDPSHPTNRANPQPIPSLLNRDSPSRETPRLPNAVLRILDGAQQQATTSPEAQAADEAHIANQLEQMHFRRQTERLQERLQHGQPLWNSSDPPLTSPRSKALPSARDFTSASVVGSRASQVGVDALLPPPFNAALQAIQRRQQRRTAEGTGSSALQRCLQAIMVLDGEDDEQGDLISGAELYDALGDLVSQTQRRGLAGADDSDPSQATERQSEPIDALVDIGTQGWNNSSAHNRRAFAAAYTAAVEAGVARDEAVNNALDTLAAVVQGDAYAQDRMLVEYVTETVHTLSVGRSTGESLSLEGYEALLEDSLERLQEEERELVVQIDADDAAAASHLYRLFVQTEQQLQAEVASLEHRRAGLILELDAEHDALMQIVRQPPPHMRDPGLLQASLLDAVNHQQGRFNASDRRSGLWADIQHTIATRSAMMHVATHRLQSLDGAAPRLRYIVKQANSGLEEVDHELAAERERLTVAEQALEQLQHKVATAQTEGVAIVDESNLQVNQISDAVSDLLRRSQERYHSAWAREREQRMARGQAAAAAAGESELALVRERYAMRAEEIRRDAVLDANRAQRSADHVRQRRTHQELRKAQEDAQAAAMAVQRMQAEYHQLWCEMKEVEASMLEDAAEDVQRVDAQMSGDSGGLDEAVLRQQLTQLAAMEPAFEAEAWELFGATNGGGSELQGSRALEAVRGGVDSVQAAQVQEVLQSVEEGGAPDLRNPLFEMWGALQLPLDTLNSCVSDAVVQAVLADDDLHQQIELYGQVLEAEIYRWQRSQYQYADHDKAELADAALLESVPPHTTERHAQGHRREYPPTPIRSVSTTPKVGGPTSSGSNRVRARGSGGSVQSKRRSSHRTASLLRRNLTAAPYSPIAAPEAATSSGQAYTKHLPDLGTYFTPAAPGLPRQPGLGRASRR